MALDLKESNRPRKRQLKRLKTKKVTLDPFERPNFDFSSPDNKSEYKSDNKSEEELTPFINRSDNTDIKSEDKSDSIANKSDNKLENKSDQRPEPPRPTKDKVRNKSDNTPESTRIKVRNKSDFRHPLAHYKELPLKQRMALEFLAKLCLENGDLCTGRFHWTLWADQLGENLQNLDYKGKERVRRRVCNLFEELTKKHIISRMKGKRGRGGTMEFFLNEITHSQLQLVRNKSDYFIFKSEDKSDNKSENISSSNSLSINTNTTEEKNLDEIQIPKLLKEKGFGLTHLKQMISKFEFTVGEIQQFLEAYAFDLQGEQGRKLEARGMNLIGYFFGALKNGGYNPVSKDFKTAEDQAMEDQLNALEERKRVREERVQRIFQLKFEEWLDQQGREELLKLVPPVGDYMGAIHRGDLLNYFQENVHAQNAN